MRICMIGKYPPIQGGTSMRHYACAHALARRGHTVHVVTNAREVEPAFRLMMDDDDWAACEKEYPGGGRVRVHWTSTEPRAHYHIPWHNPFASKLASVAAEAIRDHGLELIASYYLEPYAVAGYLAARMTGRPHVIRNAGSDVGRLLRHHELEPLYRHIFLTADAVITSSMGRDYLSGAGADDELFCPGGGERLLPGFSPDQGPLDIASVLEQMKTVDHAPVLPCTSVPPGPYIGIYGKHHESKGTFDLLEAVAILHRRGRTFGVLVLGRGTDAVQERLEQALVRLDLREVVVQLPFLPPWRVPEFIRACRAVCFLERDFGIPHRPIVAREVLACGVALVASAEKLMMDVVLDGHMIHRYNCLAARDVRDHDALADLLDELIASPELAATIARRGLAVSRLVEAEQSFPLELEQTFRRARDSGGDSDGADSGVLESDLESELAREVEPGAARRASDALLYRMGENLASRKDDRDGADSGDELAGLYPTMLKHVSFLDATDVRGPVGVVYSTARVVATEVQPAARALIESLDGSRRLAQVTADVAAAYDDDDELRRSVRAAIVQYFELGLVALHGEPPSGAGGDDS